MKDNTELIEEIIKSKLPLNWITAEQFSLLTGIPKDRLAHRKKKWQEGLVWINDGNIYYSLEGFNEWQNRQAKQAYLKACGLETEKSKSISANTKNNTLSHFHTQRMQRVSRQPLKLEAS